MVEMGQMFRGVKWESSDAPDWLADGLRDISEALCKRNPDAQAHGILGGEYGYGQDYDGPVFAMHPYYWGDCECGFDERDSAWSKANPHVGCYQNELDAAMAALPESRRCFDDPERDRVVRALCEKHGLTFPGGCMAHCTCSHDRDYAAWREQNDHAETCRIVVPNFLHKPSGLRVHWYKYIGRGMTWSRAVSRDEWAAMLGECLRSLADRVCWVLRWREDGGLYYCELGNGDGRFGGPRSRRRARRFDTRAEARKFRNMHWSSEEVAIVRRKPKPDRLILTGGDVDGLVWNVREWRKRGDGWRAEVLAKIGGVSPLAMRILAALARHESEVCDG